MIAALPTLETTDTRLAGIYNEISLLQAACSDIKNSKALNELKERLYFLQWKQESLTVVNGLRKKQL